MEKISVRYRTWYKGQGPSRIKLQVPGWAGEPGYTDGVKPQPWHCKPFVDASTYGLELIYPFDSECVVTVNDLGEVQFSGDFSAEALESNMNKPPFMSFAPNHYGFTSSIDIQTDSGFISRIEPHPRFYTDITGECPIAVAGHLESEWWSRIFFVVFKTPRFGERHVFRKGEPYAQILILPKSVDYEIRTMSPVEGFHRYKRDNEIVGTGAATATHSFYDHKGNKFDNKYKVLSRVCERKGADGVDEHLAAVISGKEKPLKKIAKLGCKRTKK